MARGQLFDGTRLVLATADGLRPLEEASLGIFEPKMSPDGSRIAYQDGDCHPRGVVRRRHANCGPGQDVGNVNEPGPGNQALNVVDVLELP